MNRKIVLLACGLALCGLGGAALSQEGVQFDTDLLGRDYREVHLRPGQGYEVCAKACADEQQCRAWTWVPQNLQRAEGPNCWLKDGVPEPGRVGGLVSGLRGYGLTPVATTQARPNGAGAQGAAGSDRAVGNIYDTDFNDMTVTRWDRGGFEAVYAYAAGRLVGRANGSTVTGYWYQETSPIACPRRREGSSHYGRFSFRFNADRSGFTGQWSHCEDAPDRDWNGTFNRTSGAGTSTNGGHAATATAVGRLVLFEGDNFGGRSVSLDRDTPSLHIEALEFGDSAWSLAAQGRWLLCEHVDYEGECREFQGDHATLNTFAGTISSARYLGAGADSRIAAGGASGGAAGVRQPTPDTRTRQPNAAESAAQRAARVAAEEAERRAHDRIREGIGRLF